MSLLAKRYARAIFEVASERGAADAVAADLARVASALDDAALRGVLRDPKTTRGDCQRVLTRLMGDAHELSKSLLGVLLRRRREAILPELRAAFDALARDARGEIEGLVESARQLGEEQQRALGESVSKRLGKKVLLRAAVTPELLGGVRLRVGNTLYDGSVATALEELERRLMDAPIP